MFKYYQLLWNSMQSCQGSWLNFSVYTEGHSYNYILTLVLAQCAVALVLRGRHEWAGTPGGEWQVRRLPRTQRAEAWRGRGTHRMASWITAVLVALSLKGNSATSTAVSRLLGDNGRNQSHTNSVYVIWNGRNYIAELKCFYFPTFFS